MSSSPRWDAATLEERLGIRVVLHGSIGSTMEVAGSDTGPIPAVHLAEEQTAGRGRRGRTWESPPGNLYATIAWPDPDRQMQPAVLAAIQVAWAEAIGRSGGPLVRCKWPNDGFVDGAKWAGVLGTRAVHRAAAGGEVLLVGLGANLTRAPAAAGAEAAALKTAWGESWPGRERVGVLLLEEALAVLASKAAGVRERLTRWPRHDVWTPGELVSIETRAGRVEGVYSGITEDGLLRLEREGRITEFAAGDAFGGRLPQG